ncbi:glycosyltransferase family 2 protein [Chondrinema litorale]|uniref:glycosyltransferase family 2 protein n=1 Tax=Chondrinema litorale TaxID=2994555 RepID=UPI0025426D2A|nr:glycosyltransferase family 2 protein [Chondrinema litorale]UZR92539.1 glycosyltransferase family 2 protein [Chondrinema litorale]
MMFSIILPTYNRDNLLSKAIESVQNQTFEDWELIIVDDGSTDNTVEVIKNYQSDLRIKYIYQENAERSTARNNGIKNAKGQYICFLDSDDYYLSNHLSVFYNEIIKNYGQKASIYFVNTWLEFGEKKELFSFNPDPSLKWQEQFLLSPIAPPRFCIHKDILRSELFNPKIRIGEDTDLWVRIASFPVYYIPESTHVTCFHDGRSVSRENTKNYLENLYSKKNILRNIEVSQKVKAKVLHDAWFAVGQSYEENRNFLKMVQALFYSGYYLPEYRLKEKLFMIYNNFKSHILN